MVGREKRQRAREKAIGCPFNIDVRRSRCHVSYRAWYQNGGGDGEDGVVILVCFVDPKKDEQNISNDRLQKRTARAHAHTTLGGE